MRDKDLEKSKRLREEFVENDLLVWFSYLEKFLIKIQKIFFNDEFI